DRQERGQEKNESGPPPSGKPANCEEQNQQEHIDACDAAEIERFGMSKDGAKPSILQLGLVAEQILQLRPTCPNEEKTDVHWRHRRCERGGRGGQHTCVSPSPGGGCFGTPRAGGGPVRFGSLDGAPGDGSFVEVAAAGQPFHFPAIVILGGEVL